MKKRYTSDPKQASRRNAFTNKNFLILLAFLAVCPVAWAWYPPSAGTYYLRSTGSGNNFKVYSEPNGAGTASAEQTQLNGFTISSGTYTLVFENTSTIIMNGQIFIKASEGTQAHLVMELGTGASANPTLKITGMSRQPNSNQDAVFYIYNNVTTTKDQHTITVQGNDPSPTSSEDIPNYVYDFNNNFVIDGDGPVMTVEDDGTSIPQMKVTTAGNRKSYGLFRIQEGTLTMKNVTVQNFATTWANGGVIQVYTNQNNAKVLADIDHCYFKSIASRTEIVLKVQSGGTYNDQPTSGQYAGLNVGLRDAKFKNCKIEYTFGCNTYSTLNSGYTQTVDSQNGTFRSIGQNSVTISLENCHLTNNYGCPVRWHGSRSKDKLIVKHCKIENNYTLTGSNVNGGGGLLLKGPAQISQCTIQNNRTNGDGGGIYLSTYTDFGSGTSDLVPDHSILELDGQTLIDNNTAAGNGGGVAINGLEMNNITGVPLPNGPNYIWYNPDGEPFKLRFVLGGATISNNKALGGDGGGVWINRYNRVTYFKLECELDKGTISTNQCSGKGGGVAIITTSTFSNPTTMPNTVVPQNVTVTIGREGETTNKISIDNNTAATYGGGMYVEAYPITYNGVTSNTTTTVYDYTEISNNTASTDGGGLYVKQGNVSILQNGSAKSPTFIKNTATSGNGGGLYLQEGSITLKGATIGGYDTSTSTSLGNIAGQSGGGIFVETGDVLINPNENETTSPTKIDHNIANLNGGGLSNRNGKVVIFGSFDSSHTYPVEITNNQATTGSGGGIFCIGDASSPEYDIRMRRVKIEGNKAKDGGGDQGGSGVVSGCGGGIYLQQGKISIINGKLNNNEANVSGGGVYTHSGDIDINPTREERQASEITNNVAGINGGGLNTHSGKITVQGNNKDTRILITGNTATTGSGGGIFCMGNSGNVEYITLLHADLINNKAENDSGSAGTDVTPGCGGGMYLQKGKITVTDVKIQGNYAKNNGGGINNHSGNIDVNGCLIGGTTYYDDGNPGQGNKAGNSGGGIYTNAGDIDIKDYVETEGGINRYESKITYNEAVANGGGINTHQGTITINGNEMDDQIEISFNKANKGGGMYANAGTINAYNALIRDNTATQNGGGINNHSGDITLYGGMLSNNTAETGHGGGAYTNVGDIDLFQFPSSKLIDVTLEDGTKVYNNIALKNGGAFNNHTGRVDIRHATLYNNTSTQGNGGAIFCEGPHANVNRGLGYTIRLLCSDMVQNKTRGQDGTEADPTGRGGGVYLKYGSIYAHYSNILNNEANISGGGLDNHNGNILLYGCDIIGNRAIELDGGGIFTKQGHITTGPSTRRDGSAASKATVIQKNSANYNGGGIYNQEGDITLNGDLIGGTTADLGNTAQKGDGGGVYIANGTINMKGGKIAYNTANSGNGGGVYSGGGEFNIEKRDDNPKPITLIVDVEVKRDGGQNATVHYHLVDQGKYGVEVTNVKHGIVWGEGTPSTTVTYGETSGYTYAQGEPACQRITIPSITADKTYKVKSFFQYDYNSNTYTGYSDEMEFITYSNTLPTVISGTVSNITKNSAEGSGKIQDNGGSDITDRGVQLWTGSSTPPSPPTGLYPSTDATDFFTVNLTSLSPNTTYYARAYATNSTGTGFGATVEFKTLKNTPDMGSGPLTVTTDINSVGQIVVTASYTMPSGTTFGTGSGEVQGYGFVWSTDDDPELYADHTIAGVLSSGTTFTAQYVGAREGIAAYVRAYATYEESAVTSTSDPTNYSITKPKQFFTPYLNGDPVVRAIRISGITQNSATITCKIYSGYNSSTTTYGVHLENDNSYYSSTDYNPADSTYTVTLTGLAVNTTYYLKAYATNDSGTTYSYGNGYNFTTLPVSLPNVVITNVNTEIDPNDYSKVKVTCRVESTGGEALNSYGVIYDVAGGSSTTQNESSDLNNGEFTYTINGLTAHQSYWVKAFATNATAGTHISQPVSFITNYDKPTVTTQAVSNIAYDATLGEGLRNTATGNYTITPSTYPVQTHGICWSVLHRPTRTNSDVSDTHFVEITNANVTSTGNFTQPTTQRFSNTKYYVRAYASTELVDGSGNLPEIVYSNDDPEIFFITLPAMVTESASNIGKTSATLSGQIASRDSEGYLIGGYYGVCWGTSANPTRADGYFTEQQITSANASTFDFSLDATTNIAYATATEYHYRAYYKSSSGDLAYGTDRIFNPKQYGVTVSASPTAGGTVSVYYNDNGTTCTVTATANPGYTFTNWTEGGSVVSTSAEYEVTIGSTDHDLEANFTLNNYTVTVVADPAAGGTVSGGGSYAYGSNRTVTASANSGYAFVNWTDENGEEVSTETSYTFTVTGTTTLTAHFDAIITVTISPDGTGTVTGAGNYSVGSTCTLEAIHESGYHFVNWTEGGSLVSTDATYSFTVLANRTLVANFEADPKSRSTTPRSRDIYPAPAREPWDWDDDEVVIAREVRPKQSTHKANVLDCHAPLAMTENATACGLAMTEDGLAMTDTLPSAIDSLIQLREQLIRDVVVEPVDIPMIDHNSAEKGGGVYMARNDTDRAKLIFSGGSSSAERGKIIFNTATEAGGGIYIDTTAHMWMKGHCEVNANNVPKNKDGAGIYLKGRLYVGEPGTGADDNGLIVNQNFAMDGFNEASYNVDPTTYTTANKTSLNNVCLMRHTYNYDHSLVYGTYDDESSVITLLSDITGSGAASNIGFHVTQGFCPVIATSTNFGDSYVMADNNHTPTSDPEYVNEGWLQNIMSTAVGTDGLFNSNGAIFEDTESYVAIHTRTTTGAPFNSKYIYLWGCWTHPAVKSDPETNNPMAGEGSGGAWLHHYKITNPEDNAANSSFEPNNNEPLKWEIYSEEGLAWFSAYVNGLNVFKDGDAKHHKYVAEKNSKAEAVLMADLDLSAHFWVPIGTATVFHGSDISSGLDGSGSLFEDLTDATSPEPHHFSGSFDGQGHTIKGIDCRYLSGIYKLGLFGYLDEGAVVKNVFVDNSRFEASDNAKGFHIGGIAGKTIGTATVSASEARSTIDITNAKKSESFVGGLVGQTVGTSGNPTIIHSSMAMPEITGAVDYMGGLVGQLGGYDKLYNSFSNPKFNNDPDAGKYIGGLVGVNDGTVENCYARLQNATDPERFGYLAGTNNTNDIKYSYIPSGKSNYQVNGSGVVSGHGTYTATTRESGKYGFKHRDQALTLAAGTNTFIDNDHLEGGLMTALNNWVTAKDATTYHPWMRTMASSINDDLPILNFKVDDGSKALTPNPAYNAVGSKDGMYMEYVLDVNDKLTEYAALASGTPEIYLYDANTQGDGTTHQNITVTNIGTTPEVKLYIHEDVGIKVSGAAASTGLKARVGVTLDNSSGNDLGGKNYDWHMFSSAINGVPMGITYNSNGIAPYAGGTYQIKDNYSTLVSTGITDSDYGERTYMDPPLITWNTAPGTTGYFPTNTPYGTWGSSHSPTSSENPDPDFYQGSFDFYCYGEKHYQHWINFKREGVASFYDHWRQDPTEDGYHLNIPYTNETNMINGKGYMVAMSKLSMLMADGTLNNGDVSYTATYTVNPSATVYDEMVRGTNLIGNPYQSYLDFDKFAKSDGGWTSPNDGKILNDAYYVLDADKTGYIAHPHDASLNPEYAPRYIHPHQGFFVRVSSQQDLKFTEGMRVPGNWKNGGELAYSDFREDKLNYPLVNLMCYDNSGKRDITTVEINRPEIGGAHKMKGLRTSNGLLYARFENNDYQALFAPEGVTEVPVRFEPLEDDIFTIKWSSYNGDFHYLHLIDNLTGADVDMLRATEYRFEGRTTDYASRFKLVFNVTGIEEPDDPAPPLVATSFAFQFGDELIVTGEGTLQMFDLNGRCLLSTKAVGEQSSVSLPSVAAGMYLLRLTGNTETKVQKLIIK